MKDAGTGPSLLFAGLMGVLPFLQWKHYYPITDFYTEWLAVFLGLLALLFRFRRLSGFPLVGLVPVGLILLVWLQFSLGMVPYAQQAFLISLYLLWAALIGMLGHSLKNQMGIENLAPILAWFVFAGGLLDSVCAIVQHYHFQVFFWEFVTSATAGTVYGNLAQQNHFSDYTTLALASLLYLFAAKRIPFLAALPAALFLLYTLALSGSRSAWIYLAALLLLALWLYRKERTGALLFGALLLIPAFSGMQFLAHLSVFAEHGTTTSADRMLAVARDSGIRLYLWKEAWLMFLKAPVLGIGFGQFAWHHFEYGPVLGDPQITGLYSNAHDIFLHLAAETGIAGLLLVFGGLILWARRIDLEFDIHSWWLFALLLVLFLHSLDEYPLWYAHFLGLFMLLLGMGEARAFRLPLARAWIGLALLSGIYLTAGLMNDYLDLEGLLYPSYHSGKPPLKPEALYEGLYRFRKGTLLAPYVEYPMAEMLTIDRRDLGKKLELSERAAHFAPSGMLLYRRAALLALSGNIRAAKVEIDRASSSDPELLGAALHLYAGLEKERPDVYGPLAKEVNMKLKERNIAFHHQ